MHTRRALVAGLLVVAVAGAGQAGATLPAGAVDAGADPLPAGGFEVTLVTGDRASVTGDGRVVVRPGPGRERVTFLTHRSDQETYVIPSDALPLLRDGHVDRQLFDVALLHEMGYHDVREDLPLIVADEGVTATAAVEGVDVVGDLPAIDAAAVRVDKAGATGFWERLTSRTPASTVWLDAKVEPTLDESVPQVGAPAAWGLGLDGTGVTVAVLDTGIDADHPDLDGQVVAQENFTGEEDGLDVLGHGTPVASIIAGTGAASGGQFRGVAPGAELLDGKVCAVGGCLTSHVLAGMQWAAEQGAQVVNMSLGWVVNVPLAQAVQTLTDEYGVLFVVSAGNSGPADATVLSPGTAAAALTVGAVDKDDQITDFSSRGPSIADGTLKPDLTAPGDDITAADSQHRDNPFTGPSEGLYFPFAGTSAAAPHVTGAAAILRQQHPDWSPAQVKAALMASARQQPQQRVNDQGAGRLDVARALTQTVATSPASVSFDRLLWPHAEAAPQTRTVTYHNDGDDEVSLDLALTTAGPGGDPVPAGMFTLDPSTVTVPAGGSAEVELTTDPAAAAGEGYFGGWLTAAGADLVVGTPFGVDREPERYDVTFSHLDRDGAPTVEYSTLIAHEGSLFFVSSEPEVTARLAPGEYLVASFLAQETDAGPAETVLVHPRLEVTRDQAISIDARMGEPIQFEVDDPSAVPTFMQLDFGNDVVDIGVITLDGTIYTAQLGPDQAYGDFNSNIAGGLAVPDRHGSLTASKAVYHLGWAFEGRFPTGFHREVARAELAAVRADHAAQVPGSVGFKAPSAMWDIGFGRFSSGPAMPLDLPSTRTEYFNTDQGVAWRWDFEEVVVTGQDTEQVVQLVGGVGSDQPGSVSRERWNYGVFGPAGGVDRFGDELFTFVGLYSDAAGHSGTAPATGRTAVFRDGELVDEVPELGFLVVPVPPEPASYRVEVEAERSGSAPLSRRTSVVWEFESSSTVEFVGVSAPLVRFVPNLAPDNTVRAGGRPLPVLVDVDSAELAGLEVAASFDDGQTWHAVPVVGRHVWVTHPPGAGFVSLRAAAADPAGGTVEQTVIRAYEFR